ncbi:nuclease-related domain-containing protein [Fictibacillus gelatini]|uniref:nuclease-related domain-containing protein n=1 Tax=Fictibacillus gelatini TaxID=225985 RepID=UPI0004118628|nr:nuclease-related domain-containing protein [Fictibacillus gelatini]
MADKSCKVAVIQLKVADIFHQLIRITKECEESFPDPILQVKHQQHQFVNWLKDFKFPLVPVEGIVVLSNPNSIIKTTANWPEYFTTIIKSQTLLPKIETFKNQHNEEQLSNKELRKLEKLLIKHHTPLNLDVLSQYEILSSELLQGVSCPNCSALPMKRAYGTWICSICSFSSKDAHLAALQDYCLLIRSTITNQQFREFLKLPSSSIARKLLTSLNFPYDGAKKGRVYNLLFDE